MPTLSDFLSEMHHTAGIGSSLSAGMLPLTAPAASVYGLATGGLRGGAAKPAMLSGGALGGRAGFRLGSHGGGKVGELIARLLDKNQGSGAHIGRSVGGLLGYVAGGGGGAYAGHTAATKLHDAVLGGPSTEEKEKKASYLAAYAAVLTLGSQ